MINDNIDRARLAVARDVHERGQADVAFLRLLNTFGQAIRERAIKDCALAVAEVEQDFRRRVVGRQP